MRPAATEIAAEGPLDLAIARVRGALEERLAGHDHAVDAVAALGGLLFDEGSLERVRLLARAQPLERRDPAPGSLGDRHRARARCLAVHEHRARPALREAAAELRPVEREVVAQDVEQRSVR